MASDYEKGSDWLLSLSTSPSRVNDEKACMQLAATTSCVFETTPSNSAEDSESTLDSSSEEDIAEGPGAVTASRSSTTWVGPTSFSSESELSTEEVSSLEYDEVGEALSSD